MFCVYFPSFGPITLTQTSLFFGSKNLGKQRKKLFHRSAQKLSFFFSILVNYYVLLNSFNLCSFFLALLFPMQIDSFHLKSSLSFPWKETGQAKPCLYLPVYMYAYMYVHVYVLVTYTHIDAYVYGVRSYMRLTLALLGHFDYPWRRKGQFEVNTFNAL